MKRKVYFSIILAFAISDLYSQNWEQLSIPESPSRYDDVFFLNENLGWAADGWGAAVYKTTDGGLNWTQQLSLPEQYMRNIEFLDENIGILGILSTEFYRTTDGGNTWTPIQIPGVQAICGLDAVGESTFYGCGAYFEPAYIIKSTDKGENWEFINMDQYATALVEVLFIDEQIGFASGGNQDGGIIIKTIDGGQSWTEIYNSGIPGELVWKMQILYSNPNLMFGAVQSFDPLPGKLIKSSDGGQTWISRDVPDPFIQGVGFITENHGWMGGHNTGFLETFDAGETWTNTGFGASLNRFQIFSENLAYCSGHSIYKYTDNISVTEIPAAEPKNLDIKVSQNPIDETLSFTIDFPRNDHILVTLFDETGRKLKQLVRETILSKCKKEYRFNFPYKSGVYYLHFHNDVGYQSKKIIKK